jgi:hypothetical protein
VKSIGDEMTASDVRDTLLIALGAWLIGGTIGVALGIFIARFAHNLFIAAPHLHRLSVLLPWRTVVLSLLIVTWTPVGVVLIGLRPLLGLVNTGLDILLLALLLVVSFLFEQWFSSPFVVHVIAGMRTLATLSLAAAAFLSDFFGIGWYMTRSIVNGLDEVFQYWLILVVSILIVDLVLGIIQLVVADHVEDSQWLRSINKWSQSAE